MRRMRWNDIPFDENANPAEKALEFDLQVAENQANPPAPVIDVEVSK